MRALILILGLLIALTGSSQERDTFQPDSIYRINHVKTIIRFNERTQSKAKLIYNYDRQGRWIEFILTDNFVGDKIQMKVAYTYDNTGKLVGETKTSYAGNRMQITDSKFEHDEKGRVVSNKKSIGGQLVSEETYTYDPFIEHEKQYRDGKVYRESTTYYEYPNYTSRYTGMELADKNAKTREFKGPDGKVTTFNPPQEDQKWDYTFENTLDEEGRIVQRKRFSNGELQDEITYRYNDKGLLIEKTDKMITSKFEIKELFEYKYWD